MLHSKPFRQFNIGCYNKTLNNINLWSGPSCNKIKDMDNYAKVLNTHKCLTLYVQYVFITSIL